MAAKERFIKFDTVLHNDEVVTRIGGKAMRNRSRQYIEDNNLLDATIERTVIRYDCSVNELIVAILGDSPQHYLESYEIVTNNGGVPASEHAAVVEERDVLQEKYDRIVAQQKQKEQEVPA